MVWVARIHLLEHNILRALTLYQMGTLKDVFEIALRLAEVLASGRSLNCHDGGLHLRPVHLDTGKGNPRTFYARRALDSINSGQGVAEPLDQAEVAARNRSGWS